jgi:hypothetical protein
LDIALDFFYASAKITLAQQLLSFTEAQTKPFAAKLWSFLRFLIFNPNSQSDISKFPTFSLDT